MGFWTGDKLLESKFLLIIALLLCYLVTECLILLQPLDYSPLDSSVQGFPRQYYWNGLPFLSLAFFPT